ncbi:MAG TPA: NAD(P)-binding domain-containing protein [Vicinamibacterales bacterium]|jgi:putative flavoprotein involved in K+ transport|nr:NAD(P)-binding domain-containing protein [Vicinamibacterales bacterium]
MRNGHRTERVNTVVIGAGQAGLSVGYHLKRLGIPFIILDAHRRVGDPWRKRWDSLRLFTPARYAGLDGMPFPAPPHSFPTKDEMGDYLETYARRFRLPVELDLRVDRVSRQRQDLLVVAGDRRFEANNVVVAMATFQQPHVPVFAGELDPAIVQVHSFDYRNPRQLRDGPVLVVGAGNSGAEIALEAAKGHRTWLAGRDTGHVPFHVDGRLARYLLPVVLRGLFHRVLTVATPMGRRLRPKVLHAGGPLVRTKPADLTAAGVERLPRVVGARNGLPLVEGDRVLEVANVIWCTGFHPGFSWLDLPVFDPQGDPQHEAGVVRQEPGLYFVGLHFLYAYSSTMIHGVGRDAERVARHIVRRTRVKELAAGAPAAA